MPPTPFPSLPPNVQAILRYIMAAAASNTTIPCKCSRMCGAHLANSIETAFGVAVSRSDDSEIRHIDRTFPCSNVCSSLSCAYAATRPCYRCDVMRNYYTESDENRDVVGVLENNVTDALAMNVDPATVTMNSLFSIGRQLRNIGATVVLSHRPLKIALACTTFPDGARTELSAVISPSQLSRAYNLRAIPEADVHRVINAMRNNLWYVISAIGAPGILSPAGLDAIKAYTIANNVGVGRLSEGRVTYYIDDIEVDMNRDGITRMTELFSRNALSTLHRRMYDATLVRWAVEYARAQTRRVSYSETEIVPPRHGFPSIMRPSERDTIGVIAARMLDAAVTQLRGSCAAAIVGIFDANPTLNKNIDKLSAHRVLGVYARMHWVYYDYLTQLSNSQIHQFSVGIATPIGPSDDDTVQDVMMGQPGIVWDHHGYVYAEIPDDERLRVSLKVLAAYTRAIHTAYTRGWDDLRKKTVPLVLRNIQQRYPHIHPFDIVRMVSAHMEFIERVDFYHGRA